LKLQTVSSNSSTNAENKNQAKLLEYDIISSSAVRLSDESSTKETTPVHEQDEKNELELLTSTPVLVRRIFTSSKQRLNESLAEVNVTLESQPTMNEKMSDSMKSMDSTDNTSTITKDSVIPDLVITAEEGNTGTAFFSAENLSSRQEITHLTQSRVLYRSKSPSQSRISESSDYSEEKKGFASQTSVLNAMEGAVGMAESESAEGATAPGLDSHNEPSDVDAPDADQSDSESNADQEELWVTETSEMVTSFVTETVRKTKIDEDGNEVIEETVRVLGADGREVSPNIVTLMRSPSFVRKN